MNDTHDKDSAVTTPMTSTEVSKEMTTPKGLADIGPVEVENLKFRSTFFKRTRSPIWTRALAFLIDIPIISLIGALIASTTSIASVDFLFGPAIVAATASFFYHACTEASPWQATAGKKAMGLKNMRVDGGKISIMTALLRSFARISSWVTLGAVNAVFALFGQRATYHDRLTRTRLVSVKLMLAGDEQKLKSAPDMQWGVIKKILATLGWLLSLLVCAWFIVLVQASTQTRAMLTQAYMAVSPALQGLKLKYESDQKFPASLDEVSKPLGAKELEDANLLNVEYIAGKGVLLLALSPKTGLDIVMYIAPVLNSEGNMGKVVWVCGSRQPMLSNHLPSQCPSAAQLSLKLLINRANGSDKK